MCLHYAIYPLLLENQFNHDIMPPIGFTGIHPGSILYSCMAFGYFRGGLNLRSGTYNLRMVS